MKYCPKVLDSISLLKKCGYEEGENRGWVKDFKKKTGRLHALIDIEDGCIKLHEDDNNHKTKRLTGSVPDGINFFKKYDNKREKFPAGVVVFSRVNNMKRYRMYGK